MDFWKIATIGIGVAVAYMLLSRGGGVQMALSVGPTRPGRDRGTQELAIKKHLLGSKAVAEGAKKAQLGPELADQREEEKKQRKG